METWKLGRTKQCAKCPWRVDTDPFDIPNGYDPELHEALKATIATPGEVRTTLGALMACHESITGKEDICLGWLSHQLGPGNNIALRLYMRGCENADQIELVGEQHETFEDTLP